MRAKSDVAIVGAGVAGLHCALILSELREDLSITLLDETEVGGSARWAVGSFTAGGTKWQAAAGISDSPADHFNDLLLMCSFDGGSEDDARYQRLLRRMCDAGPSLLEELETRGINFSGPYLEAPHRRARMHNVMPTASRVVQVLAQQLRARSNVAVCTGSEVTDLSQTPDGYVLETRSGDFQATRVVLASGDCSACHPFIPAVNPGARGIPIRLAQVRLGARRHEPQIAPGLRTVAEGKPYIAPTDQLVQAGWIVWKGRHVAGADFLRDPASFAGSELYLELERTTALLNTYACTYPGSGYARMSDLQAAGLAHPVAEEQHRLVVGPMQVMITLADGALDIDDAMRVLRPDGIPIQGLYACGTAGLGGIRLGGHGHHLLWAAATGAFAARRIAGLI